MKVLIYQKRRIDVRFEICDSEYVENFIEKGIDLGIIYAPELWLHPAICRQIEVKDDKVYFKSRWPMNLCINGGIKKKEFIYMQFATYELQEQYEIGNVDIEYYLNTKKRLVPKWNQLHDRKGRDSRQMLKYFKSLHQPTKTGCIKEAREYRHAGYVPLCCMCNKNEKLLLE